ncbi:MAG: hydantoinase B/oxoprolinase family protein [Alphaproteobacteria bacterium]|nr:hydantoinase B/oxoprolinase family protein [Alphaproteobacteria bacterium]
MQPQRPGIDPIAMEVFTNRLCAVAEDMFANLVRSSFSTNIKERRDCSVGLFDGRGRLIAQAANTLPGHLGSLIGAVEATLAAFSVGRMVDGDAFICNDPYLSGGTHLPDISIITPVFAEGRVAFFTGSIGHHSDVGGVVPGSISGSARSVFEEGIRIPLTRLVAAGQMDQGLLNLIVQNTREPEERAFDIMAQVATNARGARGLLDLVAQRGLAATERAVDDIIAHTAHRLRLRIAALRPGTYGATSYLDDDGVGEPPVALCVTVTVGNGTLHFDFTGSGPEARGAVNLPFTSLRATVHYAVKALLDPALLPNDGMFHPVSMTLPEASILNPRHPAAVGARSLPMQKLAGAIFAAFRPLLPPERNMASSNDGMPAIVFSGRRRLGTGAYVYLETVGGGVGARFDRDGMDAVQVHLTNTSNLPAEALENEYDLLVDEYAMVEGSGGSGRTRGGLGIARQIRSMADDVVFSVRSDGHLKGAEGFDGGCPGLPARLRFNPGRPDERVLHSKVAGLALARCDSIRLETAGGGGYGPPAQRPLSALADDLADGLTSEANAIRDYGAARVAAARKAGHDRRR